MVDFYDRDPLQKLFKIFHFELKKLFIFASLKNILYFIFNKFWMMPCDLENWHFCSVLTWEKMFIQTKISQKIIKISRSTLFFYSLVYHIQNWCPNSLYFNCYKLIIKGYLILDSGFQDNSSKINLFVVDFKWIWLRNFYYPYINVSI